jgi:Polyketide cyclase / dehydrase and lipid transport
MFTTISTPRTRTHGGRPLMAAAAALLVLQNVQAVTEQTPTLTVREALGVYTVSARFVADQPATVVLSVLTDYGEIPRFLPDVRTSVVRERGAGWAVVEQEAGSGLMMFSKRVHLVLDIQEQADAVLFRDRCGRSFARYEGAWRLSQQGAQTVIKYELTAQPRFDVPGWMLKRVVRRDSAEMIGRLQREIAGRGAPSVPQPSR